MRIAITGGTGFVGSHLATFLAEQGHEVVVVSRGVDQRAWANEVLATRAIDRVRAGLDSVEALTEAFRECDAVAHCAGINREIGSQTYAAIHVQGTENVVRAAQTAGVGRLAFVSFLRARPNCGSGYHESKWEAEEIVRSSGLDWAVLKPGMMFGRGDHMLDHLSRALLTFPVYVGIGPRRVRPLAVQDAVAVLSATLVDGSLSGKTVGLVGPTELSFDDAARLVGDVIGRRRPSIRAPLVFHYALALCSELTMTVPLVSRAQVRILKEEVIQPTLAPDTLPTTVPPPWTAFDRDSIRAGLPDLARFGRNDVRCYAGRRQLSPT